MTKVDFYVWLEKQSASSLFLEFELRGSSWKRQQAKTEAGYV